MLIFWVHYFETVFKYHQHFLRGSAIILTGELPGVNTATVSAIGASPSHKQFVELELRKLEQLSDDVVASLVHKLPSLRVLKLRLVLIAQSCYLLVTNAAFQ